ncbi:damage-inducible protein CinA [Bdellovibrio bacteriovorus]|uniref:Damage-inducible protein CinA n=1 Tax=Bdellovibrio bacteriovorus TaxID=959 RepID=A0A150WTH6_BDEBC|nr:CinA family protein [Bdellovibrio bacteriovorus]KYG67639.1 damage-inducible protein CinA [Bdellovibrio bacteriovorus]
MSLNSEKLQELIRSLRDQKLTVGFAESCTGGALSAFLTEQPGISDIFLGSVVSYSNEAKEDLLGVRRDTLMQEGAVSEAVARQMAHGVRRQLKTDWSVAITGIAGPSGGTTTKPVGTVCIAIAGPAFEDSRRLLFSGDRKAIQHASVDYSVNWLCEALDASLKSRQ